MTLTTRLPVQLQNYLDRISQPFGGLDQVLTLLTDADLEYLLTFPGFISLVKPWAATAELTSQGYQVGTPYQVLDQKLRFLYTASSATGFFGENASDLKALQASDHGSFLHISFHSSTQPILGLLWVCNQLSPEQRQEQIQRWAAAVPTLQTQQAPELYLESSNLLIDDLVQSFYLPGLLQQYLTPQAIKAHPQTQITQHLAAAGTFVLQPGSGWYYFQATRQTTAVTYPLLLTNLIGTGAERLLLTGSGSYFLQLAGDTAHTTFNSTTHTLQNFHLEGSLAYTPEETLFGQAVATADSLVHRAGLFYPQTEGIALSQADGIGSIQVTVIGSVVIGFTNSLGFRLPDFMVSELLTLVGTTTVDSVLGYGMIYGDALVTGSSQLLSLDAVRTIYGEAEISGGVTVNASGSKHALGTNLLLLTPFATDPLETTLFHYQFPSSDDPLQDSANPASYTSGYTATTLLTVTSTYGHGTAVINN